MNSNFSRRTFLKTAGLGAVALSLPQFEFCKKTDQRPNVIFILADDLGYGELGCYGQEKIRTPNIDKLAVQGMKFTDHYSGSTVCAPSRCVLLTGKHTGHSYIRGNDEMNERGDVWKDRNLEGQRPLLPNTYTIGTLYQKAGYTTGAVGKWGLGGPGDSGEPNKQGFDHWYGYLCQRVAHNYYPTHLWRNGKKHILEGNEYFYPHQKLPEDRDPGDKASYAEYSGKQYSMDMMVDEALGFIRNNRRNPFFLYLPFPVPHVSIQVPEDSLKEYEGDFPETPYKGEKGYLPHPAPRAGYAAMITRMDREIGRIMALLKELGLDKNTLVIFSSDNGPTFNGGTDSTFFKSAGSLRGLKTTLYEGGIRVPMIARWPGKIEPGSESDHISAFWDFLPTFAEILGVEPPKDIDGISLLSTLLGKPKKQKKHDYLYWEYNRHQAVRLGDWKVYRRGGSGDIQIYNLREDIGEQHDVASQNPDIVSRIGEIMESGRTRSELFPLVRE
ncbi:MAG: sulfatase-like hydrolase/transferase [Candidatus Aminicenantes bacterium]|nr:sulfatase-like hydrolase/transferase [Candidatus Aminicenantes bacterium]